MEAKHRKHIAKLNVTRDQKVAYYRDAEIDPDILPLVEVLNSQWTVTAYSCGGHWKTEKGKTPEFPYLTFFIMPGKRGAWGAIWRKARKTICRHLNEKVTIDIMESTKLPDLSHDWVGWYFYPVSGRRSVWEVFRNEQEFRNAHDRVIREVCQALRMAMDEEGRTETPSQRPSL